MPTLTYLSGCVTFLNSLHLSHKNNRDYENDKTISGLKDTSPEYFILILMI